MKGGLFGWCFRGSIGDENKERRHLKIARSDRLPVVNALSGRGGPWRRNTGIGTVIANV
jgi:hypothetical protein